MIIWRYTGVPDRIDPDASSPGRSISPIVLVMVEWVNPQIPDKPETRLAQYLTHGNGDAYWLVWGMSGKLRILAWSYITPLKPNKIIP